MRKILAIGMALVMAAAALAKPVRSDLAGESSESDSTRPLYDAEVEYLLSTGKEYIDTGIVPGLDFYLEINAALPLEGSSTYKNFALLSTETTAGAPYLDLYGTGNRILFRCYGWGSWLPPVSRGVFYLWTLEFDYSASPMCVATMTGGSPSKGNSTYTEEQILARTKSITLFQGIYNKTNPVAIASFYMEKYGEPVIDLMPVRFTNHLGIKEGAFFDRISGELFRNDGRGAFVIGPDVE